MISRSAWTLALTSTTIPVTLTKTSTTAETSTSTSTSTAMLADTSALTAMSRRRGCRSGPREQGWLGKGTRCCHSFAESEGRPWPWRR